MEDPVGEFLHYEWKRKELEERDEKYSSDWEYYDNACVETWARGLTEEQRSSARSRLDKAKENEENGAIVEFPYPSYNENW